MYNYLLQVQPASNIGNFFTTGSFFTLAGCTLIVIVVSNGIQNVFNFSPKWLALLISLLVSLIAASIAKDPSAVKDVAAAATGGTSGQNIWLKYLIAVFNAFLIHASATGANQITASRAQPNPPMPPAGGNPSATGMASRNQPVAKRGFNTNWWN